jgi:hypothetical protein
MDDALIATVCLPASGITSKPANEDHLKTGQWADPGQTHLYPACRPSGNDFSAAEGNGHILNGAELALSHSGAKAINPGSARAEPSQSSNFY